MTCTNKNRKLGGYAPMSAKRLAVLNYLAESMARDWPFVRLEGVHQRTIKALFVADLIAQSQGEDGTRYKITARGERTRQAYATITNRKDHVCPRCGLRPRHVSASGRLDGYCLMCSRHAQRRAYKLKRHRNQPGRLCSRCHKRPVYVARSGWVCTYCHPCKKRYARRYMKSHRQIAQIRPAGRPRKVEVQA